MVRIANPVPLALSLSLFCSCLSSPSSSPVTLGVVKDTLGKQFTVSCSTYFCELVPTDPTMNYRAQGGPVTCTSSGGTDTFTLLAGRILTVHLMNYIAPGTLIFNPADPAHPVACAGDADCTPGNMATSIRSCSYACVNGICQDLGVDLQEQDIVTLCQADIPWPTTCPYVASQPFASRLAAIAALCEGLTNCQRIPADCWQVVAPADAAPPASGTVDGSPADGEPGGGELDGMGGG